MWNVFQKALKMNDEQWRKFVAESQRGTDTPWEALPQSLLQIRRLWLPPDSIIAFLERTAADKGMSKEAETWLNRVKRAKEIDKLEEESK